MTELTFLKVLMLVRQANQKSAIFVTLLVFLDKGSSFNQMYNIKGTDYPNIISGISKVRP